MNIVCFGANGATGRLVVRQALMEGHAVTAFTRHPESVPLQDDRLQLASGDVFDPSSVDTDLADCMLRQLDDNQNVHQALAISTVSGQPGFLKFFLTEGIGKKAA